MPLIYCIQFVSCKCFIDLRSFFRVLITSSIVRTCICHVLNKLLAYLLTYLLTY